MPGVGIGTGDRMTFWTPDNIRSACAGTWLVRPPLIELPKDRPADLPLPPLHAPITGVSTDSRSIKPGQVFIALKGETFDGHDYVAQAARAGAPIIIVHDPASVPSGGFTPACGVLKVADTGKALLRLAAAYRESLKRTKVIGVCGSNGKTTTTRLIDHLLGQTMRGSASQKSFNNAVGVPITILAAKESDQYLICEIGTNHPGEIAILGDVVRPDIAVITSIGREHLEGFGDLAGVAKEEATILKYLKPGGWAVVTGDAPELSEHIRPLTNLITFGRGKDCTLRLTEAQHEIEQGRPVLKFAVNARTRCTLGLVGEHNALNAIAALGVARRLGIDETRSADALKTAASADMRLNVLSASVRRGGNAGPASILNDAYNANPDSMLAGLETLLSLAGSPIVAGGRPTRIVAILGEMLELGAASEQSHRSIADAIVARSERDGGAGRVDMVVLVGAGMRHAERAFGDLGWREPRVRHFESADGPSARAIARLILPGDLVLIKGSRRVKLERVAEALGAADDDGDDERVGVAGDSGAPVTVLAGA